MRSSIAPAIIVIVIGVIFLMQNLGIGNFDFGHLVRVWWPLILIAVGISMLLKRGSSK
ncbi:MAG: DUF5668 domain-containing protein [Lysobacteraceae bacterium]